MHISVVTRMAIIAGAFVALTARPTFAQDQFSVTLNTAPLIGDVNGPYYIDYQFIDGSGLGDGNNTVTLSNFVFNGGNPVGSATLTGGAAGDAGSTISLTDTNFFNEAYQQFNPGATLTFDVAMTTNVDAGPTPDEFDFAILDGTLSNIPTTSPAYAFVTVDISSASPSVESFAATDPYSAIGTPTIGQLTTATPEPGAPLMLFALCVSGAVATRTRARRSVNQAPAHLS